MSGADKNKKSARKVRVSRERGVGHEHFEVLLELGRREKLGVGEQVIGVGEGGGDPANGDKLADTMVGSVTVLVGLVLDRVDCHSKSALVVIEKGNGLDRRVQVERKKYLAERGGLASGLCGATIFRIVGRQSHVSVELCFPANDARERST